jgi:hypothetical protein
MLVPEAPVHKYCDLRSSEGDIGTAGQVVDVQVVPEAASKEVTPDTHFGPGV